MQNFAAQAVIAIENTRLLNELRQRTTDLTNRWSSRPRRRRCCASFRLSPGELEPVFEAMLENATRICGPTSAICRCCDGTHSACRRHAHAPPALANWTRQPGNADLQRSFLHRRQREQSRPSTLPISPRSAYRRSNRLVEGGRRTNHV